MGYELLGPDLVAAAAQGEPGFGLFFLQTTPLVSDTVRRDPRLGSRRAEMISSKLLIVAQQEIWYHLRQWTFYMTILVMPLVFAALGALPRLRDVAQEAPLPPVETILSVSSATLDGHIGLEDGGGGGLAFQEAQHGGVGVEAGGGEAGGEQG